MPRRLIADQRTRDCVAMDPGRPVDRPLGAFLHAVQPPDLSPPLHADHTLLLARSLDQARVRDQPDNSDSAPDGPVFNRRRWTSIQAAPTPGPTRRPWALGRRTGSFGRGE